MAGFIRPS